MKKILLIDVDSKIPNIALMKISAYHKSIGDNVSFLNTDSPDKIYASIIFKWNRKACDSLRWLYPDADIIIGGSGYDINSRLPEHIELMKPDYTLYPDCDYSIGFASRGCNRKCYFCIVPDKEGIFKINQHPEQWHNPEFNKIVFLDNNILFDKKYFFDVVDWCIVHDLKVWFCQGIDIRLVDSKVATKLNEMKTFKPITFAWDNIKDESTIRDKIKMLSECGFTKNKFRSSVQFYVYTNDDTEYDSAVYRCRELKKIGCNAFVMFNKESKRTPRIKRLQRWANRRWLFWSIDLDEYAV